jgi:hypothetical protein
VGTALARSPELSVLKVVITERPAPKLGDIAHGEHMEESRG